MLCLISITFWFSIELTKNCVRCDLASIESTHRNISYITHFPWNFILWFNPEYHISIQGICIQNMCCNKNSESNAIVLYNVCITEKQEMSSYQFCCHFSSLWQSSICQRQHIRHHDNYQFSVNVLNKIIRRLARVKTRMEGPLLLKWFNLIPSMGK